SDEFAFTAACINESHEHFCACACVPLRRHIQRIPFRISVKGNQHSPHLRRRSGNQNARSNSTHEHCNTSASGMSLMSATLGERMLRWCLQSVKSRPQRLSSSILRLDLDLAL